MIRSVVVAFKVILSYQGWLLKNSASDKKNEAINKIKSQQ